MGTLRRLVYSPKVWAFIKTQEHGIFDVTNFIVAGEVNRVVNEVSSANITLRNSPQDTTGKRSHYGRFTVNPRAELGDNDAKPMFHPMDPITIYMARYYDKPVQVFTGFLDTTPYVELFPGTITLQASCTLKRLLHTYWDPALPFTRDFLSQFGWLSDVSSGQLINPGAMTKQLGNGPLTDSGFGDLLFAVLNRIGGWREDEIHIEKLPPGLTKTIQGIYNSLLEDNVDAQNQFATLLERMIGTNANGAGGGADSNVGTVHGMNKIVPLVRKYAEAAGVPPLYVLTVGFAESSWDPNASNTVQGGHYGYFQTQVLGPPYSYYSQKTVSPSQAKDLGYVAPLFCGASKYWLDKVPSYGKQANWKAWAEQVQGAGTGPGVYPNWDTNFKQAQQAWAAYKDNPAPGDSPSQSTGSPLAPTDPTSKDQPVNAKGKSVTGKVRVKANAASVSDGTGSAPAATQHASNTFTQPVAGATKHIVAPWGQNRGNHLHAGVDIGVPVGTPVHASLDGTATVDTTSDPGGYGWFITIDHNNGLFTRYAHLSHISIKNGAKVKAGDVIGLSGGAPGAQGSGDAKGPHLHFEVRKDSGFGYSGTVDPMTYLNGGKTPPAGQVPNGTTGTSVQDGNILSQGTAAAFATSIEFPGVEQTIEAEALQGQKSLMNDQPLMPFVQQLAGASMRHVMSLPNGSLIAFFPDYFGTYGHRAPYWEIDDIEITSGKIELSDDALATHVFVVGDTFPYASQPGDLVNKLASGGVVTIFNAFNSGDWMIEGGSSALGQSVNIPKASAKLRKDKKTNAYNLNSNTSVFGDSGKALAFLQKFGARPLYQEEPFIRSPFFEAFMAFNLFQLAWSRQFLTAFELTFMPELYPGGRVVFKQHGFACYIDAVTHIWDYTNGFTTSVNFSAPSAYTVPVHEGDPPTIDHNPIAQGMIRSL